MKSKILFYFVFLLSITISFTSADELKIKLKIENEIITNYDISDEINYLISLNNNLKKLYIHFIFKYIIQIYKVGYMLIVRRLMSCRFPGVV